MTKPRYSIHFRVSDREKDLLEHIAEDHNIRDLSALLNLVLRGKLDTSSRMEILQNDGSVRNRMVHIYMSEQDKDDVVYEAMFSGMSTSKYVRGLIYGYIHEFVIE